MKTSSRLALVSMSMFLSPATLAADIDVMTQNQYLGADIAPLVEPGISQEEFFERVLAALGQVAANRPRERLSALAGEIADRAPHLVGLQEVFAFSCEPFPGVPNGCGDPSIAGALNDHLQETMDRLGDSYRVVGEVENLNIDLPLLLPSGLPVVISVIDRDVILARQDVPAEPLPKGLVQQICPRPSGDGCNYSAVIPLPDLGVNIERGFVAATAVVGGETFLFVNTHLETRGPAPVFQALQAFQLVQSLDALRPLGIPVILVGDFNSDPNDPAVLPGPAIPGLPTNVPNPYVQLTAAGLTDVWLHRPGRVAGLSCCQADDLSNHQSRHYERIDLIWSSLVPDKVKQARVLGSTVNFKTRPPGRGLWPSDHGAVAATLEFSH
jgi:hypothetical protein